MGFGIFSGDKKTTNKTTNENYTYTETNQDMRQYSGDIGLLEGDIELAGDGNTITRTDHGAVEAARLMNDANSSLAKSYLGAASDLSLTTTELAIDAANDFASQSFEVVDSSHDFVRDINNDSLEYANSTFSQMLGTIERDASASREQTANSISKAYDLAATHSRSEGGEAMDRAVKVMAWGGGALVLGFVVMQVVKNK